jgi:arginyl-tRNA synthetase
MLDLITAPVTARVAELLKVEPAKIAALYAPPAKGVPADLALPCFQLAKAAGKAPPALAAELAGALGVAGVSAAAAGPFLNLTFAAPAVAAALLPALSDAKRALRADAGAGKVVCIDFSSPNIAKHMAFHHIRSTMIGNALAAMYEAVGWKAVRINFLGDWGTAFGRLIAGWKRENLSLKDLEAAPDKVAFLNQLYVRISRLEKEDPAVEQEARAWSKKCEEGDAEALSLWQIIRDVSVAACRQIYEVLGVRFDDWNGEAHYRDAMGPIIAELKQKNLLKLDQGAQVVDLSSLGMKKPCLILRSDGGSLYATRDLAACDDRFAKYHFERSIYEVDLGQSLHFKEWFAVAKLLGRPYADRLRHVGHGLVLMWNDETSTWEKVATRKGVPMMLMDVLQEGIERARAIIAEKNPELAGDERERVARAVGVGAVVFNDLKNGRTNDIKFKFEEALRFDGETGPYLQFAHARLCSIERKFAEAHPSAPVADVVLVTRDDEKSVLLAVARLRAALERAVESDEPSVLAQALLALAAAVASWLTAGNHDPNLRVLCPDPKLSASRLALARAARGALGEACGCSDCRRPSGCSQRLSPRCPAGIVPPWPSPALC